MAHTVRIASDKTLVIEAGVNPLTVTVKKADGTHRLQPFIETFTILANASHTITYTEDGIYLYNIVESLVSDCFYHIQYGNIKEYLTESINRLLNNTVRTLRMDYEKYDVTSLILLGIRYLGGNDFVTTGATADAVNIPIALQPTHVAIIDSVKYISEYTLCNKV